MDEQKFWELTKKIEQLLKTKDIEKHQPIVVKVKRSCAAFQEDITQDLNVGPYDFFLKRVKKEAIEKNSFSVDKIAFFLHQKSQINNFNIRLIKPLHKDDIEEVIKL